MMRPLPLGYGLSRLPLLFALVGSSLGCSEASAPPVEACPGDPQVTVQVSAGTRPTFSWTPACGMTSIRVFPMDAPAAVWVVYGGSIAVSNPFRSGTRYGQSPPGTFVAKPPAALQSGAEYQVLVYRWIGEAGGEGGPFLRGVATFRP